MTSRLPLKGIKTEGKGQHFEAPRRLAQFFRPVPHPVSEALGTGQKMSTAAELEKKKLLNAKFVSTKLGAIQSFGKTESTCT